MFAASNTSRVTTVLRVLLLLVAAGALVLIGRATAPDDHPTRSIAGVPVGFEHNADGAEAAAMTYVAARTRAKLLAPDRRMSVLRAVGTRSFAAAADRDDQRQDLAPLAGQDEGRYMVTALGSRMERYADDRAEVTVWLLQTWAADAAIASFSTQSASLVWAEGDWRLDRQATSSRQAVPQITQRPRHDDTRQLLAELTTPRFGRP